MRNENTFTFFLIFALSSRIIIKWFHCSQFVTFAGYHYDTAEQGPQGHAQRIFAIKYHPEIESVFVAAGWDNCLKVSGIQTFIYSF